MWKSPKLQGRLYREKEISEKAEGGGPQRNKRIRASTAKPWGEMRDVRRGLTSVLLFQAAFVSKFTSYPFLASARPYFPFLWNDVYSKKNLTQQWKHSYTIPQIRLCIWTHRMIIQPGLISLFWFLVFVFHSRGSKGGDRVTYLWSCLFENNMQKGKNNPQLTTVFLAICLI